MIAGSAVANYADGDIEVMAKRAEKDAIQRAAASDDKKRKFVPSSGSEAQPPVKALSTVSGNPHEINIDDDDDEQTSLSQKPIPAAVFGTSLGSAATDV